MNRNSVDLDAYRMHHNELVHYIERGTSETIGKPYVFEHCRGMQNQIVSWESL